LPISSSWTGVLTNPTLVAGVDRRNAPEEELSAEIVGRGRTPEVDDDAAGEGLAKAAF
jgi:hypothetical protein